MHKNIDVNILLQLIAKNQLNGANSASNQRRDMDAFKEKNQQH